MYQERASRVPGAVLWQRTSPAPAFVQRVLPDGCMDLIWVDGELVVAGPDTAAHVSSGRAGAHYVGLRFAPGSGPAILGVPAHELRDQRVPLADLWPSARVRRLSDRVGDSLGDQTGVYVGDQAGTVTDLGMAVEEAAARSLRRSGPPDPMVPEIVARVRAGVPVADIADAAGISERQLHRWCLGAFGYGPRTLGRILRMNRAVDMARTGLPFATVAVSAGYADQAHLAREVKALAGVPLGALVR